MNEDQHTLAPGMGFLAGGGSVGELMRAHDWSGSPLGAPGSWPQSLRSVVSLMLNSKFPMFVAWGSELGFLYNAPYAEILGGKHPAALGGCFRDIWAEIWPDIAPLIDAAMAGGAIYRENLPLVMNRKGYEEATWFTFSYSPVGDESGGVGGMFCAVAETTAQVLAGRRQDFLIDLEASLARTGTPSALLDHACHALRRHLGAQRVGGITLHSDGRGVDRHAFATADAAPLDPAWVLTSVLDATTVPPVRATSVVYADLPTTTPDPRACPAPDTRALAAVPWTREGSLAGCFYVSFAAPHHWNAAEVALIEDVAARTWAALEQANVQAALRRSEARFRALVTASAQAMYRMSPDWSEMRQLEGRGFLPDTRSPSRHWLDTYIPPEDQPRLTATIAEAIATRSLFELEHRVFQADGGLAWIHSRAVPMLDERGEIAEWFGAASDISGRKRDEEALRRLTTELEQRVRVAVEQREAALARVSEMHRLETVGQLTGGVAHDFNNLLTPIFGALEMLAGAPGLDDRGRRMGAGALQAAERARTLVQRLLAFSRRQHLAPRSVDVARLVDGLADVLQRSLGAPVRLTIRCPHGLPAARVDAHQLEMALLNLAVNARDAMPDGGTLTIAASTEYLRDHPGLGEGAFIRLSVTDSGVGMDEATRRRAIEPFFTTKAAGRGTGLGLSSVHGLAVQSGGDFVIESTPGAGTTASLWLPVSQERPGGPAVTATSEVPAKVDATTVLLVDDDDLVRRGTAEMMVDAGFAVVEADSGHEALGKVRSGLAFDLLVTDYAMPGMNGAELARILRGLRPGLPALMITGFASLGSQDAGDLPRLAKPFRLAELTAAVAGLLDGDDLATSPVCGA